MGIVGCILGRHAYSDWYIRYHSEGAYDQETWWERKCMTCGHIDQKEFVDDTGE